MNAAGSSDTTSVGPATADTAEPLTPGELLKRERERRSISLLQAAEDLHLDTRVVQALEANRFELLGPPVYSRGHLRKYAALLGLSPEYIIQRYEASTDVPQVPTPVPASSFATVSVALERRSNKGPVWMAIALFALAIGWWIFSEWKTTAPPDEPVLMEPPAGVPTGEPGAALAPEVTTPPAAVVATTATPAASVATATTPAAGDVRLRLEYNGASWTEIYDAGGKRLMFGLGDTGRARTISGAPPLRVTLGNASAVTVQVNDRSVVVPRQSGRDSARFLIAGNGAVQMMSGEVSVE
jgi:cytoskeleton protein RodZ